MALKFKTDNPQALLNKFKELINQTEAKGKIDTWEEHGKGFRHTSKNWTEGNLFVPDIPESNDVLRFTMAEVKDSYGYAYYHGHLLQVFVQHLNTLFVSALFTDTRNKK